MKIPFHSPAVTVSMTKYPNEIARECPTSQLYTLYVVLSSIPKSRMASFSPSPNPFPLFFSSSSPFHSSIPPPSLLPKPLGTPESFRSASLPKRRPFSRPAASFYAVGRPIDTQTLIVTATVLAAVAFSLFLGLKVIIGPHLMFACILRSRTCVSSWM